MAGFGFGNVGFVGSLTGGGVAVPPGSAVTYRFNCGTTDSYTDASGNVWAGLSAQNFDYSAYGYASPAPDARLYETVLYPDQLFTVPIPAGVYTVTGRWRELYFEGPNLRLVNLKVAGAAGFLFQNIDGYRPDRAPVIVTSQLQVTVAGTGGVVLDLTAAVSSALLCALEFTKQ